MFCREQVAQLRDALPDIRKAGAELVLVGNDSAQHARAFRKHHELDFPLLVDPELRAYRTAALRRGVLDTFGLGTFSSALRALSRGARQGPTQGDPWQLGGAVVIAPGGELRFRHVSRHPGDHASVDAILRALG